jgi:hypothetical protein
MSYLTLLLVTAATFAAAAAALSIGAAVGRRPIDRRCGGTGDCPCADGGRRRANPSDAGAHDL